MEQAVPVPGHLEATQRDRINANTAVVASRRRNIGKDMSFLFIMTSEDTLVDHVGCASARSRTFPPTLRHASTAQELHSWKDENRRHECLMNRLCVGLAWKRVWRAQGRLPGQSIKGKCARSDFFPSVTQTSASDIA